MSTNTLQRHRLAAVILCSMVIGVFPLHAQTYVDNLGHVPTPQAMDLGRYGDVPVSFYTGRADITVPIYSFCERGVPLNISLSYDTSGLLVNKLPGWVGPGWTLNAGGCITRVQNDDCDEMGYPNVSELDRYRNYFQAYGDILKEDGSLALSVLQDPDHYEWSDYAPDIFYFNFMGMSGSFFLGADGEWKVCSESNLVVEFDVNDTANYVTPPFSTFPASYYHQPKAIKGFTLYDDAGNEYVFGGNDTAIEYSVNLFRTTDQEILMPWVATSWYLRQVKDRTGRTLYTFSYTNGEYLVQLYRSPYSSQCYMGTLNLPVYLSGITVTSIAEVAFTMEHPYAAGTAARHLYPSMYNGSMANTLLPCTPYTGAQAFYYLQKNTDLVRRFSAVTPVHTDPLAAMDIRFLKGVRIGFLLDADSLKFELGYSDEGRRHLASLTCCDKAGQCYRYAFNYHSYSTLPADYLTNQHDYGGYYNRPYNSNNHGGLKPYEPQEKIDFTLTDSTSTEPVPIDSIRKPDLEYSLKGMLTELIYPTGGKVVLEYELNDFGSVQTENRTSMTEQAGMACGLRVKSITEYTDSAGSQLCRQRKFAYVYPDSDVSSGQLVEKEGHKQYYEVRRNSVLSIHDVPIIPLATSFGTQVGYSYVREIVEGIGAKEYRFTNFSNAQQGAATVLQPAENEFDVYNINAQHAGLAVMRGKLLEETVTDTKGVVQQQTQYAYRTDNQVYLSEFAYGFGTCLYRNSGGLNMTSTLAQGALYKIYYPKYDVVRSVRATRYGDAMVRDTVYYTMTTFNQQEADWVQKPLFRKCTKEQTSRKGISTTTDYSYQPCDRYFLPLETTTTWNGTEKMRTDKTHYALMEGIWQPRFETTQLANGTVDTLVTYDVYTHTGQLKQYTRRGESPTLLFWNVSSDRLAGKIQGPYTAEQLVFKEELSLHGTPSSPLDVLRVAADGKSVFEHSDVQAETYLYNRDGSLRSVATGNGVIRSYQYDGMGRLAGISNGALFPLQGFSYHYVTGGE